MPQQALMMSTLKGREKDLQVLYPKPCFYFLNKILYIHIYLLLKTAHQKFLLQFKFLKSRKFNCLCPNHALAKSPDVLLIFLLHKLLFFKFLMLDFIGFRLTKHRGNTRTVLELLWVKLKSKLKYTEVIQMQTT